MDSPSARKKRQRTTERAQQETPSSPVPSPPASTSSSKSSFSMPLTHPKRLEGLVVPSVFVEFSGLAAELGAVNMGPGFPNWDAPEFITSAAEAALRTPQSNTYSPPKGDVSLLRSLAQFYSGQYHRQLNPDTEIMVTAGAAGALSLVFQALVEEGDEVVLIEPFFDIFRSSAILARAKVVPVPLRYHYPFTRSTETDSQPTTTVTDPTSPQLTTASFRLDVKELEAAMSPKTKLLVINSPHNPTGKVFSREELAQIAAIVARHPRCFVLSDEVYEHVLYDGMKHTSFCTLPHMWERTITVSGAAKTFAVTGWKVGWAIAPEAVIRLMVICQQWTVVSVNTPLQQAVAHALQAARQPHGEGHATYLDCLRARYAANRARVARAFQDAGLPCILPQGTFYLLLDISSLPSSPSGVPAEEEELVAQKKVSIDETTRDLRDYNFARWLACKHGIVLIPTGGFYTEAHRHLARDYIRVCFAKTDDVLSRLVAHLARFRDTHSHPTGGPPTSPHLAK